MIQPTNQKVVCKFICLVNYHIYLCTRRSYTLDPLIKLTTSKIKFKWNEVEKLFQEIKRVVAHNNLLTYSYFNKKFEICTYASNFQLGVDTRQERKNIYFYSRKITAPQKRYMVTEK